MEGTEDDYFDPDAIDVIDAWADYRLGHLHSGQAMDDQTANFQEIKRFLNKLQVIVEREMLEEAKNPPQSQNVQPAAMPQPPRVVRRRR
jgi:hypothetical protein